jgi:hypothetical protein
VRAALIVIGIGLIAWPAVYSLEFIGLGDKLVNRAASYEDREVLFWAVLDTKDVIFGDGGSWSTVDSAAGINLVSQIRVYGLAYFIPVVSLYLLSLGNLRFWLAGCAPALITVAFSQPIAIEPAFLMIFFSAAVFSTRQLDYSNPIRMLQSGSQRRRVSVSVNVGDPE